MMPRLTRRRALGVAVLAMPAVWRDARADAAIRLRCSLDTAPSHGRNKSLADYLQKLDAASEGRIKTELFQSGQLFSDLDVSKALIQGQVEMACPGTWTMTGFIPDCDLFQLPALYGQPFAVTHKVVDGRAGAMVNGEIDTRLRGHVLGPWLDLGYQNWYTASHKLTQYDELRGLKIRNSGGAGQAWRARFFGAIPNTTAWPNVPLALSQGTFDGLVSTDESVASAQLWEAGVKYALADHQFIGEYIPIVANGFWAGLAPDLQKLMTDLWAANIPTYRANMQADQDAAREKLIAHGVTYTAPTADQIAAERKKMMADQDKVAHEIKVSPEMVRLVSEDVGAAA
jgi:C4-dicarboxylate-binding protein DctP